MEADTSFKLAVYFHDKGKNEQAASIGSASSSSIRMTAITIARNGDSLQRRPARSGSIKKLEQPYYPKLYIKPDPAKTGKD